MKPYPMFNEIQLSSLIILNVQLQCHSFNILKVLIDVKWLFVCHCLMFHLNKAEISFYEVDIFVCCVLVGK
jgi:hypothetical protein